MLSPIQWAIIAASRGARGRSIWDFLVAQWSHPGSYWTMHLWFLVVLLIYSGVLALLFVPPVRSTSPERPPRITGRLAGWRFGLPTYLAVSSAIVVVGLAVWTVGGIAGLLSNLVSRNLVIYAPSFLTGLAAPVVTVDSSSRTSPILAIRMCSDPSCENERRKSYASRLIRGASPPRTPQRLSAFARSATARPRRSLGVGGRSRGPSAPLRSGGAPVARLVFFEPDLLPFQPRQRDRIIRIECASDKISIPTPLSFVAERIWRESCKRSRHDEFQNRGSHSGPDFCRFGHR